MADDAELSLPAEGTAPLPDADPEPSFPAEMTAALPAAEPSLSSPPVDAVAPPRNPARSSFGDEFAALHDDGPQRHGAALRYSVELLAYYYAAQGRRNPAQEAVRTLVTDRFDILDTPQFGLYAPKGQGAAVADAGLRIMDALNADSVADPVWAGGGADSTEAQRRADYAEQARGGRWVTDITGRHAILRDAQGRSVLAGSNISLVRLKGVPVVGFVMNQADQVQPSDDMPEGNDQTAAVLPPNFVSGLTKGVSRDPAQNTPPPDIPRADSLTADAAIVVPHWRDPLGQSTQILKYDLEPGSRYTAGVTLIRERHLSFKVDEHPLDIYMRLTITTDEGEVTGVHKIKTYVRPGGWIFVPFKDFAKEFGELQGPAKVTVRVCANLLVPGWCIL